MSDSPMSLEEQVSGLTMFVGEFKHALDPKRRLTIPSVWRAQIGHPDGVIVMPDFASPCLNLFPAGQMSHRYEALRRQAMTNTAARSFMRMLGRNSELLPWDSQGRIRIKDGLLSLAGLTGEVALVGAWDHMELWKPETLAAEGGFDQARMEQLGKEMNF